MDTNANKNNWKEKRRAREARASLWRRLRMPLLSGGAVLCFAFIGVPLLFNVLGLAPTVAEVSAAMVHATPTPAPLLVPETQQGAVQALAAEGDPARSQEAASQYKTLRQGDTDDVVSDIQIRLMELEYLEGDEPTDFFGEPMEEALKRFQRVHHMTETGVADDLTQELLFSETAAVYRLQEGDEGSDVKRLQNQLYDLGYYAAKRNGYFGTATQAALSAFQTKNKLNATGVADQETRDVLFSSNARPKVDPTPEPTPTPVKTPKPATPKPEKTARPTKTQAPSDTIGSFWTPAPGQTDDPLIATTDDPGGSGNSGGSGDSGGSGGNNWTGSDPGSGGITVTGSGVEAMIAAAESRQGCPYVLGDEGPNSFDCSGLLYYSLRSAGVKTGRMSAKNFARVDSWQTIADQGSLQRGDLVFFTNSVGASDIGHAGIYLGGGRYIHASSSAAKVIISGWSEWAAQNFQWAKRVF